ncbi:hypothetical protein PQU92_13895 [Asticcacaulis sp. BYS171W]|uniref:HNH endonuclease n=1 Tax=Asticcacaulis aquaticus TaxID=2984212 RepID=A0ABT5HWC9_9CAUL|nr:hypothetical protein [Asticcacaulis aquaticus]MDC7684374.1 hypothetical protein [Asticcacaulis aquaticus]
MGREKKNFGRCALCLEYKTLRDSHIIPELWYAGLYNEDGYMNEVSVDVSKHPKRVRKGYHEYLLCQECEAIIQKYEDEAKRLRDGTGLFSQDVADNLAVIGGLDYSRFKLFQLSVLWRMGVSANPLFAAVSLGSDEEVLRQWVLHGNPGEVGDYGCAIGCHTYKGLHAKNWMIPPDRQPLIMPRSGREGWRYITIFGASAGSSGL